MKVTFRGQSETHVAVFKGSDLSLCPPFNNQGWRILGMIGDPTVGEQTYPRLALLEAARKWQDAIEADRQLLPYHYSFEIGIGEMKSRGSGGVGGFRINDWAGEQIEEMGEEGKRFLLARLG